MIVLCNVSEGAIANSGGYVAPKHFSWRDSTAVVLVDADVNRGDAIGLPAVYMVTGM